MAAPIHPASQPLLYAEKSFRSTDGTEPTYPYEGFNPYATSQSSPPPVALSESSGIFESQKDRATEIKKWTPAPLRGWFIISLTAVMTASAIALEVALHFSRKKQGWSTKATAAETGILHYVYTLPPVVLAMVIIALWTWADLEIKKMQPYLDLARGNARPETSLLLDYTRTSNYFVWIQAVTNRHFLVAISALTVILGLTFQPLASALFSVKNIWLPVSDLHSTTNLKIIGQNPTFTNLVPFVAASGYAEAVSLYNLSNPQFVFNGWAIARFQIPTQVGNGTAFVNTTGIHSVANCKPADSIAVTPNLAGGFSLNATFQGCESQLLITANVTQQFGVDVVRDCLQDNTTFMFDQYKPPVFWIFDATSSPPNASVTFCEPSLTFANVAVSVNVQTSLVVNASIREDAPFSGGGNVTGPPMNGYPFNGIAFNLTNPDQFVIARENATQSILPTAIFQSASLNNGTAVMFENNGAGWASLTDSIYMQYLSLVAEAVYFVDDTDATRLPMVVKTFQARLLFSPVATHILTALLLTIAVLGVSVHMLHRRQRQLLDLHHSPGTIASAAAIVSHTDVGELLHSRQRTKDIVAALQDKRFRIDRTTGKIMVEGEVGYEIGQEPNYRRKSIRAMFGLPTTPRTPNTPASPPTS